MPRLSRAFYARPTLDVLDSIIGAVLVHDVRGRRTAGIIVEAEAYIGEDDPACHAAPGPTRRNAPLYGPPGRAYVYLNYGIHHLVNVVTEDRLRRPPCSFARWRPLKGPTSCDNAARADARSRPRPRRSRTRCSVVGPAISPSPWGSTFGTTSGSDTRDPVDRRPGRAAWGARLLATDWDSRGDGSHVAMFVERAPVVSQGA